MAHLTTARELELISPEYPAITAEATVSHLYFYDRDYAALGTRIKCNPAIKTANDREALRQALTDGRITVIGTDHAPHLLSQKEGGCMKAASGMPMIQFSLVTMLELVDQGVLSLERLVELMCHNPARLFEVRNRGFIRRGYRADLVLVRPNTPWTVTPDSILSKCGWSPMEGHTFSWRVERTLCNGHSVYMDGNVDTNYIGEEIAFRGYVPIAYTTYNPISTGRISIMRGSCTTLSNNRKIGLRQRISSVNLMSGIRSMPSLNSSTAIVITMISLFLSKVKGQRSKVQSL